MNLFVLLLLCLAACVAGLVSFAVAALSLLAAVFITPLAWLWRRAFR